MSKTIEINEPSKLRDVLRIFSALDKARWGDAGNEGLINYCADDFTPDEKLLTHWLVRRQLSTPNSWTSRSTSYRACVASSSAVPAYSVVESVNCATSSAALIALLHWLLVDTSIRAVRPTAHSNRIPCVTSAKGRLPGNPLRKPIDGRRSEHSEFEFRRAVAMTGA